MEAYSSQRQSFYEVTGSCYFFFFFSSRRRHTRSDRDWSSDVCSSDLRASLPEASRLRRAAATLLPWPRWSPQERNTVSMPVGGPPAGACVNSACSKKKIGRASCRERV